MPGPSQPLTGLSSDGPVMQAGTDRMIFSSAPPQVQPRQNDAGASHV